MKYKVDCCLRTDEEYVDFHAGLEKQTVITGDGMNITEMVEKAVAWLTEHSF